MNRLIIFLIIIFSCYLSDYATAQVQENLFCATFDSFHTALNNNEINFEKSVFWVENTYLNNELSYRNFQELISFLEVLSKNQNFIIAYKAEDIDNIYINASIFRVLTDTVTIVIEDSVFSHFPFQYDFEDVFGDKY
jgi:hypothetical protein